MVTHEELSKKAVEVRERCVSTTEAADAVGCHPATLRRLATQGLVPYRRIGRDFRFQISKLEAALDA